MFLACLVNTDKQYVYTMNEEHVSEKQRTLPDHTIIYIGGVQSFRYSSGGWRLHHIEVVGVINEEEATVELVSE